MFQIRHRSRPATAFWLPLAIASCLGPALACEAGEPAADFLKRLRAAQYYDTAITYLDRIDQYPGVDPAFVDSVLLEKAQTYIDAGVASRNASKRDEFFVNAEKSLQAFLKKSGHPRQSEARLQLGKLQMVRAAQLLDGQPNRTQRSSARQSYLAVAETFDAIVADLREKLKQMRGAKIDPNTEPEKAALRDQYRFEFLQGKINAAETRKLAAQTFSNPGEEGKELLQKALEDFTDLSENYDSYVQGALALLYRGQVQVELGQKEAALDSFIRMLEQPEADPLRDGKYQATSGMIRLWMAQSPPNIKTAIERGQGMIDGVRLNEKRTASVQELRIELAKAYLEKSKDTENQKPTDRKRAESSGRQLLIAASKVPSVHVDQAKVMLRDMGIGQAEVAELPTAEDPENIEDALEKARELLDAITNYTESIEQLKANDDQSEKFKEQIATFEQQLTEARLIAIQILRRGLAMPGPNPDTEIVNQARQFLAYILLEQKHYRDSAVVGIFLAKNAPGTEAGLQGSLYALNSLQFLLEEVPEQENADLIGRLEDLGAFMGRTWPGDPRASAANGVLVRLALSQNRWDKARQLVDAMGAGSEKAGYQRLMGRLHWNDSVRARIAGDEATDQKSLAQAAETLLAGLDGIPTDLVDPAAMKEALILVNVYLRQGKAAEAVKLLDHPKYGPKTLADKQGVPDKKFASDLYSAELQGVVQLMGSGEDAQALLVRATEAMDNLKKSVVGPKAQEELTAIYLRMANNLRDQLHSASEQQKARLTQAFRVFLDRIADTTKDQATLLWIAQTLMELGESLIPPGAAKAQGQAAELLTSAVKILDGIAQKSDEVPLAVNYQLGRGQRLLGNYKQAIDALEKVLKQKSAMLDAQIEAARAYEQWAAVVAPKYAGSAYKSALNGARGNVIWGWGKISQSTSSKEQYRAKFFEARYHVALCRYSWGRAIKNKELKEKSISDILSTHSLYPELGGPQQFARFDRLLKQVQKDLGKKVSGLPKPQS
ncbi:MAG: hypothetical protein MI861_14520 [Pirellulales bacterium]|nr:hypothetical protein [Pirellulales bacterium]